MSNFMDLYMSLGFVTFLMYLCWLGMKPRGSYNINNDDGWRPFVIAPLAFFLWPLVQTFWFGRMLGNMWRAIDN